jgi:DNA-nicking Smr family endonuclease
MDFEDILRKWEDIKKKEKLNKPKADKAAQGAPGPKKNAGEKKETPGQTQLSSSDYLRHWITVHGVEDKDSRPEGDEDDRQTRIDEAERFRRVRPQAALDLHGKSASEAIPLIAEFLSRCGRAGLEKVLIIHGKGNHSTGGHIMTDLVRKTLESSDLAGNFGPAGKEDGGRGATWVKVRKRDYFSR